MDRTEPPTDLALGNQRLLQLAEILDRADALHASKGEPAYKQTLYVHPCGTPACALGHWAAANPDRWTVGLDCDGDVVIDFKPDLDLDLNDAAKEEFALDRRQEVDLFGLCGCNSAPTAKDAAAYIRAFVARRQS